jgi:hypothetical protein
MGTHKYFGARKTLRDSSSQQKADLKILPGKKR